MGAIDTYNARTRRLLTDQGKQYWQDSELNDDINQARIRVASDSKCLRTIITGVPLIGGQEAYNIAATVSTGVPANQGPQVVEVFSVTIYWGTQRVICRNLAFTEASAKLRMFQTYTSRPGVFSMVGGNVGYLSPMPDQAYISDWDVALVPVPLVLSTDVEVLPLVWQAPVPFFAAHLAKYGEQSLEESNIFYKKYLIERQASSWGSFSSRFFDAYRR